MADDRKIVGVAEWETCDVGTTEGASFGADNPRGRNRVSSMRSSLFRKASRGPGGGGGSTGSDQERVFASEDDAAALRMPFQFAGSAAERMCAFGRANRKMWAKDMLAITHNAVRCELGLLVEILDAMKRIGARLTVGDLAQLRDWWGAAGAVMLDFLELEAKVFLPWVTAAVVAAPPDAACAAAAAAIPVAHSALRALVAQLSALCARAAAARTSPTAVAAERGSDKLAVDLVITFDRFIAKMLRHMHAQEEALPPALSAYYRNEKPDRDRMLELIITETVKSGRQPDLTLVLHTRWMTDAKGMKAYLRKVKECYDCSMSRLQSQFELNHAGTVAVFNVKAEH